MDKRMTFQVSDVKSGLFLAETLEGKDVIINCLRNDLIFRIFLINDHYEVTWNNPQFSKYDYVEDFKTLFDAVYFVFD